MARFHSTCGQRSTPPGEHRAVMLDEVLNILAPQPGDIVVDGTVGWAGHAVDLLRRVGLQGRLVGIDLDPENLPRARERLQAVGHPFALHHGNFAALPSVLATEGLTAADVVFVDLGMSSMQVDDAERGFSYRRDGPLDMRMDRSRGRTAAQLVATLAEDELCLALKDFGDEEHAERIAAAIVTARKKRPLETTQELAQLCVEATRSSRSGREWRLRPSRHRWDLHPAARTFQALRLLVNRELDNLAELLRVLATSLCPGGRGAVLSFHSGEDRLVKSAFRLGQQSGTYVDIATDPVRPSLPERATNPRARSAKLRWTRRA